jgi:hypothetical protein
MLKLIFITIPIVILNQNEINQGIKEYIKNI